MARHVHRSLAAAASSSRMLLVLLPLSALVLRASASLPPAPSYPGYELQFEDDFNGPLNEGIWHKLDNYVQNAYVPPPGIPDLVCYKADDVWTDSGNLVIRTQARSVTCQGTGGLWKQYDFTSGWVDTLDTMVTSQAGRAEIRAQLPPPTFRVWPAGWLNSQANRRDQGTCWPIAPEIDVYEVAGGFDAGGGLGGNAMCASYHWGYGCRDDIGEARTGCVPAWQADFSGSFNTYAVEWDSAGITCYFNGRLIHHMDRGTDPSIKLPPDNMYMIIETALAWWIEPRDRGASVPNGAVFQFVDWVRVWRRV